MTHTLHTLLLLVGLSFTACDEAEQADAPTGAGRGLAPAEFSHPAPQEPPPLDAIVAWVNGEPIPESVLERKVGQMRGPENAALAGGRRASVLQKLIDERLVHQWLREQRPQVTDEDVDAAIDRATQQVYRDRDAMLRHLDEQQMTIEQYRGQVRAELEERALLAPAEMSTESLTELYRDVANRPAHRTLVRLTSVLLPSDHDETSTNAALADVRTEEAFLRLPGRRISLGWIEREALGAQLAPAILAVQPPGHSEALPTPAGTEVYWVHGRREEPTPHFAELEPMLRERATQIAVGHARVELIRRLRSAGEIRIASVAKR